MAKSEGPREGKDGGVYFCPLTSKRSSGSLPGVEKQVAVAAGDQSVGPAQDGANPVPQRVIAPIAGRNRRLGEQRLCDLAQGRTSATPIEGAQIEDMARLRLSRQRAVGWRRWLALQCAPEAARGVEAQLEGVIERECDRVDIGVGLVAVDDKVVCSASGPAHMEPGSTGRAVAAVGCVDCRWLWRVRIGQPGRPQDTRKCPLRPDDLLG